MGATGYPAADAVLDMLLTRLAAALPDHFVAGYLHGSYASGTALPTSDIDLTLVLRGGPYGSAINDQARAIMAECKRASPLELDIELSDIEELRQDISPQLTLGSRLIYGADVRPELPALDVAGWARERMHAAFWLVNHVFGRPLPVRWPLALPQPERPWYGYAERRMRLADGREIATTRDLVRVTGWIATVRLAHEAGQVVAHKHEVAASYARWINDEWTPLLAQLDQHCRQRWQYQLPADDSGQALLDELLQQTLGFENDFAERYRRFVLAELSDGEKQRRLAALERLEQTPVVDDAIAAAVAALRTSADVDLRAAAGRLSPGGPSAQ
jgi:hypothetical protein